MTAAISITRTLQWVETDASTHQHYSSGFRWAEEAEHALWRKLGYGIEIVGAIPRVAVNMEYLRRIYYGEEILTELRVKSVGRSSCTFEFTASVGGELAMRGTHTCVYAPGKTSQPWPEEIRARLLAD